MAKAPPKATREKLREIEVNLIYYIGLSIRDWAEVETELVNLLVKLVAHESASKYRYAIGHSLWSTIISFESRLKTVNGLVRVHLPESEELAGAVLKDWPLIYNYTVNLAAQRNQIAHGTVIHMTNDVVLEPFFWTLPKKHPYLTATEIKGRRVSFVELSKSISWFSLRVSLYWKPRPELELLPHAQTPDLVLRLRKQAAQSRGKK